MKKGSAVVALGLFALFGLAVVSSASASSTSPRAKWRTVRIKYFQSQEPAVSTFLEELGAFGEVGDMHFGDELVIEFRGPQAALEETAERYGFSLLGEAPRANVDEEPTTVA